LKKSRNGGREEEGRLKKGHKKGEGRKWRRKERKGSSSRLFTEEKDYGSLKGLRRRVDKPLLRNVVKIENRRGQKISGKKKKGAGKKRREEEEVDSILSFPKGFLWMRRSNE